MTLHAKYGIFIAILNGFDGKFPLFVGCREYVVGANIHLKNGLSSRSLLLEPQVGEYGCARYSIKSVRIAEIQVVPRNFFVLSPWLGTFFVKESNYDKRIA